MLQAEKDRAVTGIGIEHEHGSLASVTGTSDDEAGVADGAGVAAGTEVQEWCCTIMYCYR